MDRPSICKSCKKVNNKRLDSIARVLQPLSAPADTPIGVISQWTPIGVTPCASVERYGDAHCVCGHPVKYLYAVRNRITGKTNECIGADCFGLFADIPQARLNAIREVSDNLTCIELWKECATSGIFSHSYGWTRDLLSYLRSICIISTDSALAFTLRGFNFRTARLYSDAEHRCAYGVCKSFLRWSDGYGES